MRVWYNNQVISCAGNHAQPPAQAVVILSGMYKANNDRINYWISAAKRLKKFIIAAL